MLLVYNFGFISTSSLLIPIYYYDTCYETTGKCKGMKFAPLRKRTSTYKVC